MLELCVESYVNISQFEIQYKCNAFQASILRNAYNDSRLKYAHVFYMLQYLNCKIDDSSFHRQTWAGHTCKCVHLQMNPRDFKSKRRASFVWFVQCQAVDETWIGRKGWRLQWMHVLCTLSVRSSSGDLGQFALFLFFASPKHCTHRKGKCFQYSAIF